MAKFDRYQPGQFSWVDLMTPDVAASTAFYSSLFGWTCEQNKDDGGGDYSMFRLDGIDVAGMGAMSEEMKQMGIAPTWNNYVTVEDADAAAARAQELGAELQMPVIDIAKDGDLIGRMTILIDPEGARLAVWQPGTHAGSGVANIPGAFCWNEILTRDPDKAMKFYSDLFGWEYRGDDQYQEILLGGRSNGGILPWREEMGDAPAHWSPYFTVENCDDGIAKVKSHGGDLLMGPVQIEVGRFALVKDPLGAVFYVMNIPNPD